MDIFNLAAKLSLDDSGFSKGISDAEKAGKNLGSSLQNTFNKIQSAAKVVISGVAIKKGIDLVKQLANETAAAGDRIDKQSQALGMSRKAFQEWDYILGQNGASIDSLGVSMKTLNSAILSATAGSEEYNGAMVKLGLNYVELGDMNMEDQFEAVVRAFQRMPAGAQKSALAVKLFGRNGMELLPLLNQADTSIDELRQRAEELGLIMSDDAVDAAVVYGDSLDDLQRTFNAFKYAIGAKILPTLTTGIQKITNYAGKLRKAYDQKGFTGVWETLVTDFRNIEWPTWEDVKSAIETGWNTIVSGVKGLAKIVFGENVDGSIKWPTWEDVGAAIDTAWQVIKDGVGGLAKIVFGENVDGSIKWPTWADVQKVVEDGWETIKTGVAGLATIVFGDKVDITKIDSLGELFTTIQDGWNNLKETITQGAINIATYFFGDADPTTVASTIETIGTVLEAVGAAIVTYFTVEKIKGIIDFFKNFKSIFTTAVGGNKLGLILAGIAAAITLIIENWDKIEPVIAEVGTWLQDNLIAPITEFVDAIKQAIKAIGEFLGIDTSGWFGGGEVGFPAGQSENRSAAGYSVASLDDEQIQSLIAMRKLIKDNPNARFVGTDGETREGGAAFRKTFEDVMKEAGFEDSVIQKFSNGIENLSDSGFADLMTTLRNAEGFYDEAGQKIGGLGDGAQIATGSVDNLGAAASNAAAELNSIQAPSFGGPPGHAKGLWNVPYDDYVARLHRGETVLTASQARRYRDGGNNSVDLSSLGDIVREAIASGMRGATVRSYISGRDVTDDVNRNTIRQLKARRFAT